MAGGGGTFLGRREPTGGRAAIRGSTGRVAARGGRRGATAAGTGAKTTLRGEGIRSEYEATGEQGHSSFEAMDGLTASTICGRLDLNYNAKMLGTLAALEPYGV